MPQTHMKFQQGLMLYEVDSGAFRAKGVSLEAWCRESGVIPNTARNALLGSSSGPSAKLLIQRMADEAGREVVELAYRKRVDMHAEYLKARAA